jgi:hypothetical protein
LDVRVVHETVIAPALVIAEQENDVRLLRCCGLLAEQNENQEGEPTEGAEFLKHWVSLVL